MSDFESRIKHAADEFAKSVLETLRGLTLTELAKVIQVTGEAVVRRVRSGRAPVAAPKASKRPAKKSVRAKRPLSPKQAAARKIQGQYLGLLRKFPDTQRKQFKAIAQKNGVGAALTAIKSALGRK
jgi:hypothetical protein